MHIDILILTWEYAVTCTYTYIPTIPAYFFFLHYIRPSIHTCIHRYIVIPTEVGYTACPGVRTQPHHTSRSFLEKHISLELGLTKKSQKAAVFILIPTLVWIPKKTINDKRVTVFCWWFWWEGTFFHWFVSKWCQLTLWFLKRGETRVAWTDAGWKKGIICSTSHRLTKQDYKVGPYQLSLGL